MNMLLCSHSISGKFPYPPEREQPMSEAKSQDDSAVKGHPMKMKHLSEAYSISKQVAELHRMRVIVAAKNVIISRFTPL
ncbi:hypothetical protein ACEWB5_19125 [Citrobacter koseri]|uniref:hypothetical protein n=1 Tax=Citrobacter koseri TaxID=545 RepID=UPI003988E335